MNGIGVDKQFRRFFVSLTMGWKIWFVIWSALLIINFCSYFYYDVPIEIKDILDFLFTFATMTGFFGYAFKKRVLYPIVWKLWLPIIILWDFKYNWVFINEDPQFLDGMHSIWGVWIMILLPSLIRLPIYIALFLYGFRTKNPFERVKSPDQISSQQAPN